MIPLLMLKPCQPNSRMTMNLFSLPCLSIGFIALQPRTQVPGSLQPWPNSWHCAVNKQTQARNVVVKLAQLISTATLPLTGLHLANDSGKQYLWMQAEVGPCPAGNHTCCFPLVGVSVARNGTLSIFTQAVSPGDQTACPLSPSGFYALLPPRLGAQPNRSFLQLISHLRARPHLSRWLLLATLSIVQPKQCSAKNTKNMQYKYLKYKSCKKQTNKQQIYTLKSGYN